MIDNTDYVLDIKEIINSLPHRYPFLLVDRVIELELDKTIYAIKNVTLNEPFFTGHFPVRPVMPGVLIVEALAQAAAILAYKSTTWKPEESLFFLGSIERTRFKQVVVPGDRLDLHIKVLKQRQNVWKFSGEAHVAGNVACYTEMTSAQGSAK